MSRLAFRERVESPRPRSAIAMVAIATICLASTGQVAAPALGLAAVAITIATFSREPSAAWRRNPWLLNLGLLGAVATGLGLWLRGAFAMVALAHFAVVAQGLQLLDARPRRSEFLLVALAVFQVVLAANLTDSILFPLLLVAFTVSVVWTLIVHTLRAEALEAGEPQAAQRVITPGLRRTVILASLFMTLLGLALFPILPRLRGDGFLGGGLGAPTATAGFSEQVELGELGRIRLDPTIVLRVETLQGPHLAAAARYWRGLAFDHFDGRKWSVTPRRFLHLAGSPSVGLPLLASAERSRKGQALVQRIDREPVPSGVIFVSGSPRLLQGGLGRIDRDANRSLFARHTAQAHVEYVATSIIGAPSDAVLARDHALPPPGGKRFLQLPSLDPAVARLAQRITAHAGSDAARARDLERWLRANGRYTNDPPAYGSDGRSPVEDFLLHGRAGHCEYFASAMVVMARSLGLPARLINGFAGGHENPIGGFIELSQSDAHAWVQIHYAKAGWVRYDPTPPDLRLAGAAALRRTRSWSELASAIQLWWFRHVVDFDAGDQAHAVQSAWLGWRRLRGHPSAERGGEAAGLGRSLGLARRVLGVAVLLAAAVALVLATRRRSWRRRRPAVPAFYSRALRLLGRRGHVRSPSATARAFAEDVASALPPEAAQAFRALTEQYLADRFSGAPAAGGAQALARLRDSLRE